MKKINQKAAKIFNKLINLMGEEQALKLDNAPGSYMPVHIERLQEHIDLAGRTVTIYSLAHYYEQNGDLVPDPDMTFAVNDKDTMYIYPMTFQNAYTHKYGIFYSEDREQWRINQREQKDEAVFAGQWLINIKHQQGL